jgi:hypothetical protein
MVAIGKVVFTSREHIIGLEARGKGLFGITLRYPYELRKEQDYFDDVPDPKITKDMLELATHIIENRRVRRSSQRRRQSLGWFCSAPWGRTNASASMPGCQPHHRLRRIRRNSKGPKGSQSAESKKDR